MIMGNGISLEKNVQRVYQQMEAAALRADRKKEEIQLVAISKKESVSKVQELYDLGIRNFGENRIAEALEKMPILPKDIRWHYVGKLQKNKVSKVIGHFVLIHSVDSVELAEKISSSSLERGVKTRILLEANVTGEKSKWGLSSNEWKRSFASLLDLKGIEIDGLMTMAPLTKDTSVIRRCFSDLKLLQTELRTFGKNLPVLSMGMSHDFPIAIEEGATLIRLGTALFLSSP
jgi:PLP dependent protein